MTDRPEEHHESPDKAADEAPEAADRAQAAAEAAEAADRTKAAAEAGAAEASANAPETADGPAANPPDPAAELQAERDRLLDQLRRVSADYQNYTRRAATNLRDAIELERGDVLKAFVPVLDHFDNALAAEPKGDEARKLYEGVRIVRDELMKVLQQAGVERIDVQPGEPFDPHRHEALMRQPAEGVKPDHVSMCMQPGYAYGQRTLRPAKVAVAPE